MKIALAAVSERLLFLVAFVSALVLIASGFWLVSTAYNVRMLTAEKEQMEMQHHRLIDDATQLALDQSKAAMPKVVTERATELGFVRSGVMNTVMVEVDASELESSRLEVRK